MPPAAPPREVAPPPAPAADDAPPSPDEPATDRPSPDQPQADQPQQPQQPLTPDFTGAQAPAGLASTEFAAGGSFTPTMIGDFFGFGGSGRVVFLQPRPDIVIPAQTRQFEDFIRNGNALSFTVIPGERTTYFSTVQPDGTIQFREGQFEEPAIFGDEEVPLPPGTIFISDGNDIPTAGLNENPAATDTVRQAFPSAVDVVFNGEDENFAQPDSQNPGAFNVFLDYTIIDQAGQVIPQSPTPVVINVPTGAGANVGISKIGDNSSPLPRTRVFFNYSYFDNVPLQEFGTNVNRYTPGFEYAFLDGNMSVEARFPFATTLDSNIFADGITDENELEFGNIVLYSKALLYATDTFAVSTGLGVSLPTADDVTVGFVNGPRLLQIDNESVHLLPFVGALWTQGDFFVQSFVQMDVDTEGNPVRANLGGADLTEIGRIEDQTLLFADLSVGYWLYRGCPHQGGLTGIVPMFELHYNTTVEDPDNLRVGPFLVGSAGERFQVLNATLGTTILCGGNSSLQVAYGVPIGNGSDQVFDGELRINFNYYFDGPTGLGGLNPLSMVPSF